jgi:5-methylcytosine-specific restriction endonuclease McrA
LRAAVIARDQYTCTDCGATGVPLEVDHLDRLADGGADLPPPARLETVCVPCHRAREAGRNRRA